MPQSRQVVEMLWRMTQGHARRFENGDGIRGALPIQKRNLTVAVSPRWPVLDLDRDG